MPYDSAESCPGHARDYRGVLDSLECGLAVGLAGMGSGCRWISVVASKVRDGRVGMGDAHTRLGEFRLADPAHDSA